MTSSTTPNSTQSNVQADLATAVDCMLEGTNATGFCTGTWGKYSEEGTGETESIGEGSMYHDADLAEYTCAEGALIYGAIVLRGYGRDYTSYLLCLLENAYIDKYDRWIHDDNDAPVDRGLVDEGYDTRHDVIARAKELL